MKEGGTMVSAMKVEEDIEEIDQKDDGYIELVLRVLARMCDGQHRGLQVNNSCLFTLRIFIYHSNKYTLTWSMCELTIGTWSCNVQPSNIS